ncbi:MAG: hypothetical protein GY835_24030 [bacterium]|nr:hypothetical protein [bacterium]
MPHNRKYKGASAREWYEDNFSLAEKVAVFQQGNDPGDITLVGYYNTKTLADAAAIANPDNNGNPAKIQINFWHSDFMTSSISVGKSQHRHIETDIPDWAT